MDEAVVADVNADMADVTAAGVEAEQIALLQSGVAHQYAVVRGLVAGDTVELDAKVTENIGREAGAVEAGFRRGTAPGIGVALIFQREFRDLAAERAAVGIVSRGGDTALSHILAVDVTGSAVDDAGHPSAGFSGDGQALAGVILAQDGG